LWSDTVWVFVDYNDAGTMKRLPLLPGATLTATSAPGVGRIIQYSENTKGVWVVGNAKSVDNSSGSFSATVKLHTATATVVGACAYASNYPPVGEYISATHLSFTGTPVYNLVLKNTENETIYRTSGADYDIPGGYTLASFTDATGAPRIIKCMPPATYILQASASDFCAGSEGVQFALSGTESERDYQLYRNDSPVGEVLDGTGSATTFTGSFNEAGLYTARTIADGLYCAIAMSRPREVYKNPLPDDPDVFGDTRDCPGTVTLSASSPGALIDWYVAADAASSFYTEASYTTPEIEESTTYYVQARFENTGCLSSARIPVLAEVNMAGCCDLPGVTGVTFAEFNPCASAPYGSTWTLTDDRDQKTYKVKYMADDRYWMVQDLKFGDKCPNNASIGSSTSDVKTRVNNSGTYYGSCSDIGRSTAPSCRGYFYNWAAAVNHSGAYKGGTYTGCTAKNANNCQGICPAGWHVPAAEEMTVTLAAFATVYGSKSLSVNNTKTQFETCVVGREIGPSSGSGIGRNTWSYLWTSTRLTTKTAVYVQSTDTADYMPTEDHLSCCWADDGMPVRCIRNL
jgi:uncharacterized protein (TIGR02145 family)